MLHTRVYRAFSCTESDGQRCALLSASEFLIGHLRMDYTLRNRGLELYHESIKLMSRELTLSRFPKSSTKNFDLLMAGFLLETFEVSLPKAWLRLLFS